MTTETQNCLLSPEQVQDAFIAAPPALNSRILDLSVKSSNWLANIFELVPFPLGMGTTLQELVFRASMPQIEEGFGSWRKLNNNSGCNPCEGDPCTYNWTQMGGTSMDRKAVELMTKDFRSNSYCINEIQNTRDFKMVFGKIVEYLYKQLEFYKEYNINRNFLNQISKKFVIDSDGVKANPENPYVYRPKGSARLSNLNITWLSMFYARIRDLPGVVPYDTMDGRPLYALTASDELLSYLYLNDPNLRQDAHFSDEATDLLKKYNFTTTIRGMFISAPIQFPRRFNWTNNQWVQVLPYVNGIPAEVGTYTGVNPAYYDAQYEEVLINGKYPGQIYYMPSADSLAGGANFGPQPSIMDRWQWVNPETIEDPFRRVGYFASHATIGLAPQFSEGVFGIMVERLSKKLAAGWNPEPECPPEAVTCNNSVPSVGCPCPLILSATPTLVTANNYLFTFAVPVTGSIDSPIQLGMDNGGYITGTLVALSSDGLAAQISFTAGTIIPDCDRFTTVYCANTLVCSSGVLRATDCRSAVTDAAKLLLSSPIVALTPGQDILATMGDGTVQTLEIVSVNLPTNEWTVKYAPGSGPTDDPTGVGPTPTYDMICDRGGVASVCVPPTTDASCPSCASPTPSSCAD